MSKTWSSLLSGLLVSGKSRHINNRLDYKGNEISATGLSNKWKEVEGLIRETHGRLKCEAAVSGSRGPSAQWSWESKSKNSENWDPWEVGGFQRRVRGEESLYSETLHQTTSHGTCFPLLRCSAYWQLAPLSLGSGPEFSPSFISCLLPLRLETYTLGIFHCFQRPKVMHRQGSSKVTSSPTLPTPASTIPYSEI